MNVKLANDRIRRPLKCVVFGLSYKETLGKLVSLHSCYQSISCHLIITWRISAVGECPKDSSCILGRAVDFIDTKSDRLLL